MKMIKIDDCADGMVLAKDVKNDSGGILLPRGSVLRTGTLASLKKHGVSRLVIEEETNKSMPAFSREEIEKAEEMYREVVEQRFVNPAADPMVQALFKAVLEHTAQRVLSGKP
jgi:hypothetical protein